MLTFLQFSIGTRAVVTSSRHRLFCMSQPKKVHADERDWISMQFR